jgi:hypothetical protein
MTEHLNLELEWSGSGSPVNYCCIACDESVASKHQ